jgi:hypothetical protein
MTNVVYDEEYHFDKQTSALFAKAGVICCQLKRS